MATRRKTDTKAGGHQLAAAVVGPKGEVQFIPQSDIRFPMLATAVGSQFGHLVPVGFGDSPFSRQSTGAFQRLQGGSPSLRELLLPKETNLEGIIARIEAYRRTQSWINRGLLLRAAFNASEISIQAPNKPEQTKWMRERARDLRFFSFAREWFWQLRAYGQVIVLWKTEPGGKVPVSIECADLRAHQPRGPGLVPNIVVLPGRVESLKKLIQDARGSGAEAAKAKARLAAYPPPIIAAARGIKPDVEVPAEQLAPYGYHLLYTALDRRHYEDWAFPGMYSIFGDIEMVEMARAVDINALAQYKAAILLVRLGPENPDGNDLPVMATEPQLQKLEKRLMEQARNRLPTLVARGDLRIDFVTPPIEIFTAEKYKVAVQNIFDWLGIPKAAWPGQDLQGSFASAQVTLKFLQQESKDERDLFRETFEGWFYDRAKAVNAFPGAQWPIISFDPNSLTEQRLTLDYAKLLWQMGASEDSVLDVLGLDGETEATRLKDFNEKLAAMKVAFVPRDRQMKEPQGRPKTVDQVTPERDRGIPQPRPSTAEASDND